MKMSECSICCTRQEGYLFPSTEHRSERDYDLTCYTCWGPVVIRTKCVPIPIICLWEAPPLAKFVQDYLWIKVDDED